MAIKFDCPNCGKTYKVDDKLAGRNAPCKACGQTLTIPAVQSDEVLDASSLDEIPPPPPTAGPVTAGPAYAAPSNQWQPPDQAEQQLASLAAASRQHREATRGGGKKVAAVGGGIGAVLVVVLIIGLKITRAVLRNMDDGDDRSRSSQVDRDRRGSRARTSPGVMPTANNPAKVISLRDLYDQRPSIGDVIVLTDYEVPEDHVLIGGANNARASSWDDVWIPLYRPTSNYRTGSKVLNAQRFKRVDAVLYSDRVTTDPKLETFLNSSQVAVRVKGYSVDRDVYTAMVARGVAPGSTSSAIMLEHVTMPDHVAWPQVAHNDDRDDANNEPPRSVGQFARIDDNDDNRATQPTTPRVTTPRPTTPTPAAPSKPKFTNADVTDLPMWTPDEALLPELRDEPVVVDGYAIRWPRGAESRRSSSSYTYGYGRDDLLANAKLSIRVRSRSSTDLYPHARGFAQSYVGVSTDGIKGAINGIAFNRVEGSKTSFGTRVDHYVLLGAYHDDKVITLSATLRGGNEDAMLILVTALHTIRKATAEEIAAAESQPSLIPAQTTTTPRVATTTPTTPTRPSVTQPTITRPGTTTRPTTTRPSTTTTPPTDTSTFFPGPNGERLKNTWGPHPDDARQLTDFQKLSDNHDMPIPEGMEGRNGRFMKKVDGGTMSLVFIKTRRPTAERSAEYPPDPPSDPGQVERGTVAGIKFVRGRKTLLNGRRQMVQYVAYVGDDKLSIQGWGDNPEAARLIESAILSVRYKSDSQRRAEQYRIEAERRRQEYERRRQEMLDRIRNRRP